MTGSEFERKAMRLFHFRHQVRWDLAELAFQSWLNHGVEALHIDYRCRIQKLELSDGNLVEAPLGAW